MLSYPGMNKWFITGALVASLAIALPLCSQAAEIDVGSTTISTSKAKVNADGIDQAIVSVRVRTVNYLSAPGATVTLSSSRGEMDEITPASVTTNDYGKAEFLVRSLKNGTSSITAYVNGQKAPGAVSIEFANGLDIGLAPGSLIKIPSDSDPNTFSDTAVYYFASNGRRYVFSNDKVYFTWYTSFDNVRVISIEDMTKIPIGGNVTYRPGVKPVKFQTDDKVYAVDRNGTLRWLKTEAVARAIYGADWTSKVDDINEAFYVNYKFGTPVDNSIDFMADTISNKYSSIEKDKGITQ